MAHGWCFLLLTLVMAHGWCFFLLTLAVEADPCDHYTVLDDTWRATTNQDQSAVKCDRDVQWQGWYRMFHQGRSVSMPESCVPKKRCGTHGPLWLKSPHPRLEDGIVTREVCGSWESCCSHNSPSIRVKMCPGNYTVYELVATTSCHYAYCADMTLLTTPAPAAPSPSPPDLPTASVEVVSPQSPFYSGDIVTLSCDIPEYSDWHQYVWLKDNSTLPGKTNQTITITLPLEAGQYQCSGQRGDRPDTSSMSSSVDIISNDLPPAAVELVSSPPPFYSGDLITLRCDIPEYSDWHQYVWLKDNSPVPGKTSQTITITLPLEAGQYQCSGQRGDRPMASSVSSSVNITINAPSVVILSPPPPFNSGDVVTLRCDIPESTSGQSVQYVWLNDSSPLPGETTRTITVTNPGRFQCHKKAEDSSVEPYISRPLEITFTPRLSQVVRVKMQLPPGVNVEDEAVQNAFLQQIGDKLKANGLAADAKLSWKKQPDGKVLHKEKNGKKKRDEL